MQMEQKNGIMLQGILLIQRQQLEMMGPSTSGLAMDTSTHYIKTVVSVGDTEQVIG